MNEYVVGVHLSEKKQIVAQIFVKADNKETAEKDAIDQCKEEGLHDYGISYCDLVE